MGEIARRPERRTNLSPPVPLTADHDLSDFDCGEPALDDWLRNRALKSESRFSRTFVICDGNHVAVFFCISAGSAERAAVPGKLRHNAPDLIPVSIVGRLAVSRAYSGMGLGADMLADALRRIVIASRNIGISAVMVHAKNDSARRFYLHCAEFIEHPANSGILFLPIESAVAASE
jgi:GNAT superfamily N-acetyltransferase